MAGQRGREVERLRSRCSALHRRQSAGEATVIDLQEAEAAREQAQLQQLDARSDLELRRLSLEHITGQPFVALSRLSDAWC